MSVGVDVGSGVADGCSRTGDRVEPTGGTGVLVGMGVVSEAVVGWGEAVGNSTTVGVGRDVGVGVTPSGEASEDEAVGPASGTLHAPTANASATATTNQRIT